MMMLLISISRRYFWRSNDVCTFFWSWNCFFVYCFMRSVDWGDFKFGIPSFDLYQSFHPVLWIDGIYWQTFLILDHLYVFLTWHLSVLFYIAFAFPSSRRIIKCSMILLSPIESFLNLASFWSILDLEAQCTHWDFDPDRILYCILHDSEPSWISKNNTLIETLLCR